MSANPKRLLLVSTVSGTIRGFLLPLADHFRALGWKVDAAARGLDACDFRDRFDEVVPIEWSRSPFDISGMLQAARHLRHVVRTNDYDIVHVHTPIAAFVTRAALAWRRNANRPAVVYTAHGFHFTPARSPLANLPFSTVEQIAGRWTDYLVTINRTDEAAALRLGIVPPDRLRYMPGIGIDRAHFSAESVDPEAVNAVRQNLGLQDSVPVFTMVAELVPNKRHHDVIAALALMRNQNAHVLLVGTGPLREVIEKQASDAGVGNRVHFAGLQHDVRPWILAGRALLLPSLREGLPRSIMEALCCGVPVIGSDIRGTRDLLADGGGRLFPAGNAQALATELDWFAENPEAAREMGVRGRAHMAQYDITNIIALHEELYASATTGRP